MSNLPIYQKIFRSTFIHSAIRAFFSLATALSMIFVVRLMGPHEFGKFSFVLQLAVTAGLFLSWGSSGALAKLIPECATPESKARLSSQILEISLLSILAFAAGFMLIYYVRPGFFPAEIKSSKLLFITFVALFAIFNVMQGVFRGMGRFVQWSFIEGSNDLMARLVSLAFFVTVAATFTVSLSSYCAVLFILTLTSFFMMFKQFHLCDLKLEPKVVRFGLMMLAGSVIFTVGTTADALLLRALLKEPQEVGYYFAGIRIPQMFQSLLLAPLSIPFIYYFTHQDTLSTREQILKLGTKMLGVFCGLGTLVLFSFGKWIVVLFYGDSYLQSIIVLKIYSFVFFLVGVLTLFSPYLLAINKLPQQIGLVAFSVMLLLVLDYYFIPMWKSAGSALANVLIVAVQIPCYVYVIAKENLNLTRIVLTLLIGMALSAAFEIFFLPYGAIPFFLLFILLSRLFSVEEIKKIRLVISASYGRESKTTKESTNI